MKFFPFLCVGDCPPPPPRRPGVSNLRPDVYLQRQSKIIRRLQYKSLRTFREITTGTGYVYWYQCRGTDDYEDTPRINPITQTYTPPPIPRARLFANVQRQADDYLSTQAAPLTLYVVVYLTTYNAHPCERGATVHVLQYGTTRVCVDCPQFYFRAMMIIDTYLEI